MATGITYQCDHCGYQVPLTTVQQFYVDAAGIRQRFGHPCETRPEAINARVKGFEAWLYCGECIVLTNQGVMLEL